MKFGIVAAMELELAPFKEKLTIINQILFSKNNFYVCSYHNAELILVCSGQGKTNAAVFTQILIQEFKVDAVINVGICGGISQKTNLLDVCVGEKYLHYDIRKKQSLQKFPYKLYYLADEVLLNQFLSLDVNVKKGVFGTGEGFVTDESAKQTLIEEYQIDCVDMESTAIAQTCFLNDIPFISLRVVSDKADNQAVETTEGYQQEAMKSIFELVQLYLDTYY